MNTFVSVTGILVVVVCSTRVTASPSVTQLSSEPPQTAMNEHFLLGPPQDDGPVVVRASFQIHDINNINDEEETLEFSGVLTLKWHDKRQAFDPAAVGVNEKIYQGNYQFNEIYSGWFPEVVLVNESGLYEKNGVVLRVESDGTQTLIQTVNAVAKVELGMWRFPFDRQRLEIVFEVLGFDLDEVVMQVDPQAEGSSNDEARIPQWTFTEVGLSIRERPAPYAGRRGVTTSLVVSVDAKRRPFFIVRLVMIPLAVIVLLSFSVFWMDRSSLGDRISVSFIGILTCVAYQIVMAEFLPHISYFTLMNGFLNLSFLTMCATVVVNLVVGALDQKGKHEVGNRVDHRCRWIFPLTYFGLNLVMAGAAFTF